MQEQMDPKRSMFHGSYGADPPFSPPDEEGDDVNGKNGMSDVQFLLLGMILGAFICLLVQAVTNKV